MGPNLHLLTSLRSVRLCPAFINGTVGPHFAYAISTGFAITEATVGPKFNCTRFATSAITNWIVDLLFSIDKKTSFKVPTLHLLTSLRSVRLCPAGINGTVGPNFAYAISTSFAIAEATVGSNFNCTRFATSSAIPNGIVGFLFTIDKEPSFEVREGQNLESGKSIIFRIKRVNVDLSGLDIAGH